MFRKMPFILLAIILSVVLLSPWLSKDFHSNFYGISLTIKSFIVFVLPFVVFGLLFKTAVHFANQASKMIFFLLAAVIGSNFLSTLVSYYVGGAAYFFDLSLTFPDEANTLTTGWFYSFPKWIANDQAMFAGLLLGMLLGWLKPTLAKKMANKLEKMVNWILKIILLVIPVFIVGFVMKMHYDQALGNILSNYSLIFALVTVAVFTYIAFIYFIANRYQYSMTVKSLKNILPAAIAGFGSMSSAAAMPLTILGAEKNSKNPDLARAIIPATVNIHLVGDCFAIPIFAFAVMKSFGVDEPGFANYLIFAAYFVLAKFSVAAVPGGGILVMLPILEKYLGFNAEMLSLITALYILFDPVITCANVLGNGGFALAVERFAKYSPLQNKAPINAMQTTTQSDSLA